MAISRDAADGPQGLSIHIGLNYVDPNAYGGWDGALTGCIPDAKAMQQVAQASGYRSQILLDREATALAVTEAISGAARNLRAGDYLLLTYSGHGGQVADVNGDEDDGKDETWCLWDRQLVDDELFQLWSQFAAGVRVLVLSDSCHSGTVLKQYYTAQPAFEVRTPHNRSLMKVKPTAFRRITPEAARESERKTGHIMRAAQQLSGPKRSADIACAVILISGCLDNQLSADGVGNGLFTQTLLGVWNKGAFTGSHYRLWKDILEQMPPSQSPNYMTVGAKDQGFEDARPFTVGAAQSVQPHESPVQPVSGKPSVSGPASILRSGPAPSLQIDRGGRRYFVAELATDASLFADTGGRTSANFYASWSEPSGGRTEGSTYVVGDEVWAALRDAERLYYRIGVVDSDSGWDGYDVSTPDNAADQMPSSAIVAEQEDRIAPPTPPPARPRSSPPTQTTASSTRNGKPATSKARAAY